EGPAEAARVVVLARELREPVVEVAVHVLARAERVGAVGREQRDAGAPAAVLLAHLGEKSFVEGRAVGQQFDPSAFGAMGKNSAERAIDRAISPNMSSSLYLPHYQQLLIR